MKCPLCEFEDHNFKIIHELRERQYFCCPKCELIFADPNKLITPQEEITRYEQHQNNIRDEGYVNFLNQLIQPLIKRISVEEDGLDFGSGPYPMLKELMQEKGYKLDHYDPFFAPDGIKKELYDYISSTEVVEHFYKPHSEFKKLFSLLKKEGKLAIMTGIYRESIDFKKWHYIQDDTHVSFYTPKTMEWIANTFHASILYFEKNVVIFQKD